MEDNEIMKWYMKGWQDELNGSSSTLPNDRPDIDLCYSVGASDCIIGDDIPSNDYRTSEEIIKGIKSRL